MYVYGIKREIFTGLAQVGRGPPLQHHSRETPWPYQEPWVYMSVDGSCALLG